MSHQHELTVVESLHCCCQGTYLSGDMSQHDDTVIQHTYRQAKSYQLLLTSTTSSSMCTCGILLDHVDI